jgi:tRNA-specific 2-thiouridylase
MQKDLKRWVVDDFLKEYASGRTPNPCVRCNQYLKFDFLLKKALALDAEFLATGHYAKIARVENKLLRLFGARNDTSTCQLSLRKAKDKFKDQSYFLYRLTQAQLKYILFPLGDYSKTEVRALAKKFGLAVADKPGSQEICFLSGVDYREFLKAHLPAVTRPGNILDMQGKVLGRHKGVAFYTIGQREGLGIAVGHPVYVAGIDSRKNVIVVGSQEEARSAGCEVSSVNFIVPTPKKKIAVRVKIRYNHKEVPAELQPIGRGVRLRFKTRQFAVTPGQSAVIYCRDSVIGGGIIKKAVG